MKIQQYLFNLSNRIYVHLVFWLAYYFYRVFFYSTVHVVNEFWNVVYVQFLEMPVKIGLVYFNFYFLMPVFLSKEKNFQYTSFLILGILAGGFIQLEVIRICIYWGIYDFDTQFLYSPLKFNSTLWHIIDIITITTIIKVLKTAYAAQQINQVLLQEKLETELKFLKSQLNPHFFFNTLNNLYSLILIKSDLAAETLLKLSGLMSYMLYETNQDEVLLEKELKYLGDYIELEKLRFGDELNILFQVSGDIQDKKIPPMLLVPFLENSFKHGSNESSRYFWIKALLNIERESLNFTVENSALAKSENNSRQGFGIGLNNVKRRLELLYQTDFELKMEQKENSWSVHLKIPLKKQ